MRSFRSIGDHPLLTLFVRHPDGCYYAGSGDQKMLHWVRKALSRFLAVPLEDSTAEREDRFLRRCVGLPHDGWCPRDIQGRFSVAMRPRKVNGRVDN